MSHTIAYLRCSTEEQADSRAGLDAQRVDAAHIAQQSTPDVVHIIEFDPIVMRGRGSIAPRPSDRDPCITEVADIVRLRAGIRYTRADVVRWLADYRTAS